MCKRVLLGRCSWVKREIALIGFRVAKTMPGCSDDMLAGLPQGTISFVAGVNLQRCPQWRVPKKPFIVVDVVHAVESLLDRPRC